MWLGASVNPTGTTSFDDQLAAVSTLNAKLDRPLQLVAVNVTWTYALPVTQLDRIWATGGVPLITWTCSKAQAINLSDVATGKDDDTITSFANGLGARDLPVLLRWAPDQPACAHAAGDASAWAAAYRSAWTHVRTLFQSTRVGFVWSVNTAAGDRAFGQSYYPGADRVDWIEGDNLTTSSLTDATSGDFQGWYAQWSSVGKPMLMAGGAPQGIQATYLNQLIRPLLAASREVKGFVYTEGGTADPLDANGVRGLKGLAATPVVLTPQAPSTPAMNAGPNTVSTGEVVRLTLTLDRADPGGFVTFRSNGTVIPGCDAVPAGTVVVPAAPTVASCDTSTLPPGADTVGATYSGDAYYAAATPPLNVVRVGPPGPVFSGPPSIPGPNHAYLGGFVNPSEPSDQSGATPTENELPQLPDFNTGLVTAGGRPLSIVHVYQAWDSLTPAWQLRQILASGGTPMIDWKCGDFDLNVINAGNAGSNSNAQRDYQLIKSFADELAALKAPVYLRWYYEPNIPGSANYTKCISALGPSGYIEAWRNIHRIFAEEGATNVAFVWCMATAVPNTDFVRYYPGSDVVDWIAADGYQRNNLSGGDFAAHFGTWYDDFSSYGKPMMIAETGAASKGTTSGTQAGYLNEISNVLPVQFPQIKGLVYFDAAANYDYTLTADALVGFRALAATDYFLPERLSVSVNQVSAWPTAPKQGQEIQLTAVLSTADMGGSLSFYASGNPIRGCANLPVDATTACYTDLLPVGTSTVTAAYSGDALLKPGTSPPAPVVVTQGSPTLRNNAPPIPEDGHAYLGAWLNPDGTAKGAASELGALTSFNTGLSQPLSIVQVYQGWSNPTSSRVLAGLLGAQAIPMINWQCGDTDTNVASGADDVQITQFAQELAALRAPVLLNWFSGPNDDRSAAVASCLGGAGPLGYQAAFQHIHDVFTLAGALNVAFVWTAAVNANEGAMVSYYPGGGYVDWIGADGYPGGGIRPGVKAAGELFNSWYQDFSSSGKPMMVVTGAPNASPQDDFLLGIRSALSVAPSAQTTAFSAIKAVSYLDGPRPADGTNYTLGELGLSQFRALIADPYFQLGRKPTSVAVALPPDQLVEGNRAVLGAPVSGSDNGGSVSYTDNGQPIPGCQQVPLAEGGNCTFRPAQGPNTIQATYSGAPGYAPSSSEPQTVNAAARPANGGPGQGKGTGDGTGAGGGGGTGTGGGHGHGPKSTGGQGPGPVSFPPFTGQPTVGAFSGQPAFGLNLGGPVTFAPFGGIPTLAGLQLLHLPAARAAEQPTFGAAGLSDTVFDAGGGTAIESASARPGPFGFGGVAVSLASGIVVVLGLYILVGWARDRRRYALSALTPATSNGTES